MVGRWLIAASMMGLTSAEAAVPLLVRVAEHQAPVGETWEVTLPRRPTLCRQAPEPVRLSPWTHRLPNGEEHVETSLSLTNKTVNPQDVVLAFQWEESRRVASSGGPGRSLRQKDARTVHVGRGRMLVVVSARTRSGHLVIAYQQRPSTASSVRVSDLVPDAAPDAAAVGVCITAVAAPEIPRVLGSPDVVGAAVHLLRTDNGALRIWAIRLLVRRRALEAAAALVPLVSHPDVATRIEAIQALSELNARRAVPKLIEALGDESEHGPDRVYAAAAGALAKMEATEAADALVSAFRKHVRDDTYGDLARSLGWMGDARAVPALMEAVTGGHGNTTAMVHALVELRAREAAPTLARVARQSTDEGATLAAIRALGELDARETSALLYGLLKQGPPARQLAAAAVLGRWGIPAGYELAVAYLRHPEAWVRAWACEALGAIGNDEARALLEPMTRATAPIVAARAREALQQLARRRGVRPTQSATYPMVPSALARMQPVQTALASTTPVVPSVLPNVDAATNQRLQEAQAVLTTRSDVDQRRRAVAWLAELKADPAKGPLTLALADPDPDIRRRAAEALGRFADPGLIAALEPLMHDADPTARAAAIAAVGGIVDLAKPTDEVSDRLTDQCVRALSSASPAVRIAAARTLTPLARRKHQRALLIALRDAEPAVRYAAARALGRLGGPSVVPPLMAVLADPREHQGLLPPAEAAAGALGTIRSREAVPALSDAAVSSSPTVRAVAVTALGQIGQPECLPVLIKALADPEADAGQYPVRLAAVGALDGYRVSPKDLPAVRAAARTPGWRVSEAAVSYLVKRQDHQAVPVLVELLDRDEGAVRRAAAEGLEKLATPEHVPQLIAALRAHPKEVVLIRLLGRLGDASARPALVEALRQAGPAQTPHRQALVEALGRLGEPKLGQVLRSQQQAKQRVEQAVDTRPLDELVSAMVKPGTAPDVQIEAMARLARLKAFGASPYVVRLVHSPNAQVCSAAVKTLEALRHPALLQILSEELGRTGRCLAIKADGERLLALWEGLLLQQVAQEPVRRCQRRYLIDPNGVVASLRVGGEHLGLATLGWFGSSRDLFLCRSGDGRMWWQARLMGQLAGGAVQPGSLRLDVAGASLGVVDGATGARVLEATRLAVDRDTDRDGLSDPAEALLGTDPSKPDTDGDGLGDLEDGNPLCPRVLGPGHADMVRQALFIRALRNAEPMDVIVVTGVDHELYGHPSCVLHRADLPPVGRRRDRTMYIAFGPVSLGRSGTEAFSRLTVWRGHVQHQRARLHLKRAAGTWTVTTAVP